MLPWVIVDRAPTPDGAELVLARRGDEWVIKVDNELLMSSRVHHSEEVLATMALERAPHCRDLLIGGLGLGFTLRAALDRLPAQARVTVAELSPQLVAWNRGPLAPLAGQPALRPARRRWRWGTSTPASRRRTARGTSSCSTWTTARAPCASRATTGSTATGACAPAAAALRPGGVLGVWSAGPADAPWRDRLERAGFVAELKHVTARPGGGSRHALFFGRLPRGRPPGNGRAAARALRAPRAPAGGACKSPDGASAGAAARWLSPPPRQRPQDVPVDMRKWQRCRRARRGARRRACRGPLQRVDGRAEGVGHAAAEEQPQPARRQAAISGLIMKIASHPMAT